MLIVTLSNCTRIFCITRLQFTWSLLATVSSLFSGLAWIPIFLSRLIDIKFGVALVFRRGIFFWPFISGGKRFRIQFWLVNFSGVKLTIVINFIVASTQRGSFHAFTASFRYSWSKYNLENALARSVTTLYLMTRSLSSPTSTPSSRLILAFLDFEQLRFD